MPVHEADHNYNIGIMVLGFLFTLKSSEADWTYARKNPMYKHMKGLNPQASDHDSNQFKRYQWIWSKIPEMPRNFLKMYIFLFFCTEKQIEQKFPEIRKFPEDYGISEIQVLFHYNQQQQRKLTSFQALYPQTTASSPSVVLLHPSADISALPRAPSLFA